MHVPGGSNRNRQAAFCYAEGEGQEEGQVREQKVVAQEAEYQAPEAPGKLQLQLRGHSQELQAATTPPTANQAGAGAAE